MSVAKGLTIFVVFGMPLVLVALVINV